MLAVGDHNKRNATLPFGAGRTSFALCLQGDVFA